MAHVALDGRFLMVNDRFLELSGYGREELLSTTWQEITPSEALPSALDRVRRVVERRLGAYSVERRHVCKDGRRVWVELSVTLVRGPRGESDYFICAVDDITERKLSELLLEPLTSRGLEVLSQVVAGRNDSQIAELLSYSLATIKLDVRRIIAELEVKNRKQAAARAVEIGLTPPPPRQTPPSSS